jgi:hypothetical protein
MTSRVFTLEEVNGLVPELSAAVGRQLTRRARIEALLGRLGRELGDVPERIVHEPGDSPEVRALKRELATRIAEYRAGWRAVEGMGAVLKDPKIGLLDFYGEVDGKMVWLCWKYGEASCAFYHALEEGLSGRKPIRASIRVRLLN